jgi:hypothetical protein
VVIKVSPFVYRAFGVLAIVAGLSACSIPPADISRFEAPVKVDPEASVTSGTRALHDLLTTALAGGPEGDHALARFVELWHQRRPGQTTSLLGDKATGTAYQVSFAVESAGCYAIDYFDTLSPAFDYEVRKIAPLKSNFAIDQPC